MQRIFVLVATWLACYSLHAQDFSRTLKRSTDFVYTDVFFVNDSVGYVSGFRSSVTVGNEKGIVLKTVNGGMSWSLIDTFAFSTKASWFNTVFFVDNSLGFVGGYANQLYKTTDGGNTWQDISATLPFTTGISNPEIRGIHFQTAQKGMVMSGNGEISATSDGGVTWVKSYAPASKTELKYLQFTKADTGFVWGQNTIGNRNSLILKTVDGGFSWDTLFLGSANEHKSPYFFSAQQFYSIGDSGLQQTNDFGVTTSLISEEYNTKSIIGHQFIDNQCINCAPIGISFNVQRLFKTLDGGINWTEITIDTLNLNGKPELFNQTITRGMILNGDVILFNGFKQMNSLQTVHRKPFYLYPNPVTDGMLYVATGDVGITQAIAIDWKGGSISIPFEQLEEKVRLDLSICKPGLYVVLISTNTGKVSAKVMVK